MPEPVAKPAPATKSKPVVETPSKRDCATVKARPEDFRVAGKNQVGCLTAAPAGALGIAPVSCTNGTPNSYVLGRTTVCLNAHRRSYQTVGTNGAVTGTATVEFSSDTVLAVNRLTWNETWYATLVSATGRLTTMNVAYTLNCGQYCVPRYVPTGSLRLSTVGQTVSGTISYTMNPAGRSQFDPEYTVTATNPTNDALPTGSWKLNAFIRCDRMFVPAGCVTTFFEPTFGLSYGQIPAVYWSVWYAQTNQPDKWSSPNYLVRRLTDTALQTASYEFVCNDGTFTPSAQVEVDTCFDFPNPGNYENGYLLGVSTPQVDCAELRPYRDPATGAWTLYRRGNIDGTERCLRTHVPEAEVNTYYQQIGQFYIANRVLDQDPYGIALVG